MDMAARLRAEMLAADKDLGTGAAKAGTKVAPDQFAKMAIANQKRLFAKYGLHYGEVLSTRKSGLVEVQLVCTDGSVYGDMIVSPSQIDN